jgi:hypothetical protein
MPRVEVSTSATAGAWYRQPLLWLGAVIFFASLAGCVWMIVLSARHADTPMPTHRTGVFDVPAGARSSPPSP